MHAFQFFPTYHAVQVLGGINLTCKNPLTHPQHTYKTK